MSEARPPPPESEHIPTGRMLLIGGIALGILTAASAGAWGLWAAWRAPVEAPLPPGFGDETVGMVNQAPFPQDTRAEELRLRQRARLRGYGWVDRDAGVIHIPVEQAMDQLVSESAGARDGGGGR